MQIVTQAQGGTTTLVLDGELDVAAAEELGRVGREQLQRAECQILAVDLSAVSFIDSTGLGALVGLRNAAGEHAVSLTLRRPSERVVYLLGLAGVREDFSVSP